MINCVRGEKMGSQSKFNEQEIGRIEGARKKNKWKQVKRRLKALEMRAQGASLQEVATATGYSKGYVSELVGKYRGKDLEAITGNHYGGNHRNMSRQKEAEILAPFKARGEAGEMVGVQKRWPKHTRQK